MLNELKKIVKENDLSFNSLENELSFIQGYLISKNESVPPKIFLNMIDGKSSFGFKY